jgi:proline racemase
VQFNSKINLINSHNKNIVIFGKNQYDRSPCGTGTSAKMANMYSKKLLNIGEEFINESILGTKFYGKILREDDNDNIKGIIPVIKANAFITGYNEIIFEENDPFQEGFLL